MTTPTRDELLVDGGLIYALRDGANHMEIRVTRANGICSTPACNALANKIRDLLSAHQAQEAPSQPVGVHVCPVRDIECGSNPAAWCASCPKRPAPASAQAAVPDVDAQAAQLVDWLLTSPITEERLVFTGAPEPYFHGLSRVRLRAPDGSEWTLTAGLKEGWNTDKQVMQNIRKGLAAPSTQQGGGE